jgi:streptogramin lyase
MLAMRRALTLGLASSAFLVIGARAQLPPGEFLLSRYGFGGGAAIDRYDSAGNLVWQVPAVNSSQWIGSTITPSNQIAVSCHSPWNAVRLLDMNGVEVASFNTPQVTGVPGEVGVFSDGTFAICDAPELLFGNIDLYSASGTYVATFQLGWPSRPFGNYVDSNDILWVCDTHPSALAIRKFDRGGNVIDTWNVGFPPSDVQVAVDGTVWTRNSANGDVYHLSASGAVLSSFPTINTNTAWGIARAPDGTIYTTDLNATTVARWAPNGASLGQFALAPGTQPVFITIRECTGAAVAYCTAKINSLGCAPAIASSGLPSATLTSGFVIRGDNVLNQKSGLLFYGFSGPSALPFQGGVLCVNTPLRRTHGVQSGGTPAPALDCSGVFALDMNAFAHAPGPPSPAPQLTVPGTVVNAQWWGRDPGFTAPNNTALSNALEYTICPR